MRQGISLRPPLIWTGPHINPDLPQRQCRQDGESSSTRVTPWVYTDTGWRPPTKEEIIERLQGFRACSVQYINSIGRPEAIVSDKSGQNDPRSQQRRSRLDPYNNVQSVRHGDDHPSLAAFKWLIACNIPQIGVRRELDMSHSQAKSLPRLVLTISIKYVGSDLASLIYLV